ncbi:hypothetical protein KL86CLO1_11534 [uncultured Eubacteriales bacterium]|uniref:Uncharacterized protein n=1 Tax=uncultured Eubacteriales bacterium TaxID=172733 RepID=A0A212JQW5_9FIRM|nr:hypothetical protein KL86CLO1_11534 [uncultured Eubacteriales bacterium]
MKDLAREKWNGQRDKYGAKAQPREALLIKKKMLAFPFGICYYTTRRFLILSS